MVRKLEKRQVETEVLVEIFCDVCGETCLKHVINDLKSEEMAIFEAHWGYFSDGKDGDIWECDICEKCAIKVKRYIESLGGKVRVTGPLDYSKYGEAMKRDENKH